MWGGNGMYTGSARVWGWALLLSMATSFSSPVFSQTSQSTQGGSPNEIKLQVIVVRSADEAQRVLDRLKKGENFVQLARENSIDPTAEVGGYMGTFNPAALRAELRDALLGVGPGQVSPVAHIPSGYAILKVVEGDSGASGKDAVYTSRSFALAATGAVKYVADVDGLAEAEAALLRFPKPSNWNADPRNVCELRKQSLLHVTGLLSDAVSAKDQNDIAREPAIDVMQVHFALAQLYAYQG